MLTDQDKIDLRHIIQRGADQLYALTILFGGKDLVEALHLLRNEIMLIDAGRPQPEGLRITGDAFVRLGRALSASRLSDFTPIESAGSAMLSMARKLEQP